MGPRAARMQRTAQTQLPAGCILRPEPCDQGREQPGHCEHTTQGSSTSTPPRRIAKSERGAP
eukprot:6226026-Alexandrium_andersonii.AAC.1